MQKKIVGFEDYLIDDDGSVFSNKTQRIMVPFETYNGRLIISLRGKGGKKNFFIHRLVAEAFIENPKNKPQVNHIDCNPKNNSVGNLEWCTDEENKKHGVEHKLFASGERSGRAKLTKSQVKEIRSKYKPIVCSTYSLAREYGVTQRSIFKIVKNMSWID